MTTNTITDANIALKIISDASGRMRVQASGFRFDTVRAVAIEDTVAKVTGVDAVYAYPRTASVVVLYSPESCDTAAVLSAIAEAQHIPAESVPARAPHSSDVRRVGVVRRIASGIGLALFGLRRGAQARAPEAESGGGCGSGSAQHHERDDQRRGVKEQWPTGEQLVGGVEERGQRAQRDQRVHIRGPCPRLLHRPLEEGPPSHELHR